MLLSNLRHVIETDMDPLYPDVSITILDISDIYNNFKYKAVKDLIFTSTQGLSDIANMIETEPEFALDLMKNVLAVAILNWEEPLDDSPLFIEEEIYNTLMEYGLGQYVQDNQPFSYQFEVDLLTTIFNGLLIEDIFPLLDDYLPFNEKVLSVSEKFVVLQHRVISELYIETCIETV